MWPSSRRYPRSLQEAFPADYANPIEGYKVYSAGTAAASVVAVAFIVAVVFMVIK